MPLPVVRSEAQALVKRSVAYASACNQVIERRVMLPMPLLVIEAES
jgi:hypothetical protein